MKEIKEWVITLNEKLDKHRKITDDCHKATNLLNRLFSDTSNMHYESILISIETIEEKSKGDAPGFDCQGC